MKAVLPALAALVLALPGDAWAQKRGSFHNHPHRVFVGSAFYFGTPMWYGYPALYYYYAPVIVAAEREPTIYVEKFDGTPSADAGEIYCPSIGEYYPDVQDCPNGWQRIMRAPESTTEGG